MINNICAGILAGGKSSRMGTNKMLLPWDGKTFLEHIYDTCAIFPQRLVSVRDRSLYPTLNLPFVEDEKDGLGPTEGVRQLLMASEKPYVFVMAGDMPFLTEDFLRAFARELAPQDDCLVLQTGENLIEPLCAIYATRTLPQLEALQAEGIRKLRVLYERTRTRIIDVRELGFSPEIVDNINTREDYDRIQRKSPQV